MRLRGTTPAIAAWPDAARLAIVVHGGSTHDTGVRKAATGLADAGHRIATLCIAGDPAPAAGIGSLVSVAARRPAASSGLPGARRRTCSSGGHARLQASVGGTASPRGCARGGQACGAGRCAGLRGF